MHAGYATYDNIMRDTCYHLPAELVIIKSINNLRLHNNMYILPWSLRVRGGTRDSRVTTQLHNTYNISTTNITTIIYYL